MRQTFQSTLNSSAILFSTIGNSFQSTQTFAKQRSFVKLPNFKNFKFNKFISPKIILVIFGVIIVGIVAFSVINASGNSTTVASNEKPFAPVAIKTQTINKEFLFPIKDEKGKEVSKMKFEVQNASVQNEILVKGQRARAVEGRVFLIIDIKITNSYNQGLQINSRDYIRLMINGNEEELMAADIHNDPVEAQAISTKTTRIGFPINETDKNLVLQVGEINGKKEAIQLTVNK